MKKMCLALVLLLIMPIYCAAAALSSDDLTDLEAPLAGLLATDLGEGMKYPASGDISVEYVRTYLFYMANIFYTDDAQPRADVPDGFVGYVPLEEDEVALLLGWAFGDRVGAKDLEADERTLIIEDGVYWLGLADGYLVDVTYAGEENPPYAEDARYPYDFTLTYSDGGAMSGQIDVAIEQTDDPDAPLCVADYARADDRGADGIAGNWRTADGHWCSLMEEGLIFCFNDRDELIADGSFALEDGVLSVTLNGQDTPAKLDGEAFTLTIDGVERAYRRDAA